MLGRSGSEIESTLRGRSMGATLAAGTRIRIRCRVDAGFPEGMVVAFLAGGTLVGHRVVGHGRDLRGRDILMTRGDGSLFCDPVIDPATVVGEVSAWQSATGWQAVPPAPRRGLLARGCAALVLASVRALAQISRPRTSIAHEHVLTALTLARGRLARVLGLRRG